MIAFIGCPRSGTKYISEVCSAANIDVGHEVKGGDGISYWQLAVDMDLAMPENVKYIHQVRHPLDVIGSMQTIALKSWDFICQHAGISFEVLDLVYTGMQAWYCWNMLSENKAIFTYRVEDIRSVWMRILDLVSAWPCPLPEISKDINTRKDQYDIVTWQDLLIRDKWLTHSIFQMARRYGYGDDFSDIGGLG